MEIVAEASYSLSLPELSEELKPLSTSIRSPTNQPFRVYSGLIYSPRYCGLEDNS